MRKIAISGSFDPITNGHLHIAREAIELGLEPVFLVGANPKKTPMFDTKTRVKLIKQSLVENNLHGSVEIVPSDWFTADFAKSLGITHAIRGMRNPTDFQYEVELNSAQQLWLGGLKTIYVLPTQQTSFLSSSLIKSIVGTSDWYFRIYSAVPGCVLSALAHVELIKLLEKNFSSCEIDCLSSVLNSYLEPDRVYHTSVHLLHVIRTALQLCTNNQKDAVLTAACFHDAVYEAGSHTNEADSAALVRDFYVDTGRDLREVRKIESAIRDSEPTNEIGKILHDADCAHFAADYTVCKWLDQLVVAEYSKKYPLEQVIRGRYEFLTNLIARPIFITKLGKQRFEATAVKNIKHLLDDYRGKL